MKTYAQAGVDREGRERAKKNLKAFEATFRFCRGKIIQTPYNTLYPITKDLYQAKTCDGVGTKVMLAELADKHDTIGIDAVAMVVNDCLRCGASPVALTDVIDIQKSTPELLKKLQKGLIAGANEAECPLTAGETADVPELMSSLYHINCDCAGMVEKKKIITGAKVKPGNVIIGLPSSGIHSNGLSLVRKVLFKKWGGKFDALEQLPGLKQKLVFECLKPTKIYVKPFFKVFGKFEILAAVHITGDAYLKFKKTLGKFGAEFTNFKSPAIFDLIQVTGKIDDAEMFKTFNMGWGFALVVKPADVQEILAVLKKERTNAEIIGQVTKQPGIAIDYRGKKILL
jgi:phosphoribosylformylglycinamidine cyclo-ligase